MDKNYSLDRLFDAILTLKTKDECAEFFADACTPKELQAIAQRFTVAEMLYNKRVYSDIIEETSASTATISRVGRSINNGYKMVFERLNQSNE